VSGDDQRLDRVLSWISVSWFVVLLILVVVVLVVPLPGGS
jgi:hypothetical protein